MTEKETRGERWTRRFGTWFGAGEAPAAPGTVGSLAAVPLHLVLRTLAPTTHIAAIAAVTGVGLYTADKLAKRLGVEDPECVVVDEVAGTLIALGLNARGGVTAHALSLLLFRALDIIKPFPINHLEHLRPAGLGIMADDVFAGFVAGVAVRLVR